MSYESKLIMHASLTQGGSLYIRELTDYPGIVISDNREKRGYPIERNILFQDKEYKTLKEAIEAWETNELMELL